MAYDLILNASQHLAQSIRDLAAKNGEVSYGLVPWEFNFISTEVATAVTDALQDLYLSPEEAAKIRQMAGGNDRFTNILVGYLRHNQPIFNRAQNMTRTLKQESCSVKRWRDCSTDAEKTALRMEWRDRLKSNLVIALGDPDRKVHDKAQKFLRELDDAPRLCEEAKK